MNAANICGDLFVVRPVHGTGLERVLMAINAWAHYEPITYGCRPRLNLMTSGWLIVSQRIGSAADNVVS